MTERLLDVQGLVTEFKRGSSHIRAVSDVSFHINRREVVGLVGESGCGKSVTSLSLMRLLKDTPGRISGGKVLFEGRDLVKLPEKEMRHIRGNEIAMIFQEPMTSLNPVLRIGKQLEEPLTVHLGLSRSQARERAIDLLRQVGIPRAEEVIHDYPHQLSGGMRQRVMIAIAIACKPKLLIADEPTTALDVTIQAQILELIRKLRADNDMSVLLITHDLGVVAEMCDRVIVMYAGRVVEEGTVQELFANPRHPYTKGLIQSVPKLRQKVRRLESIPGNVPDLSQMPQGCKFAPRCAYATERCHQEEPGLIAVEGSTGRKSRCWLANEQTWEERGAVTDGQAG
jgi:peptide/nickel transport system ATP-binding protein